MREKVEAELKQKQDNFNTIGQQIKKLNGQRQQVLERIIELRGQVKLLDELDKEADNVQDKGRDQE